MIATFIKKMSGLFDKQSECTRKLPQAHKVCNERKMTRHACLKYFDGKKEFIRHVQKSHLLKFNKFRSMILNTMKVLFV